MKKLFVAAALLVCLLMTGCIQKTPDYYNEIKRAKEQYEKLDSAHIVMTDLNTGEDIMDFSFMFTKNDEMVFSYYSCSDGVEERAFSDGAQFFFKTAGDDGWHVIKPDDPSYLYNLYSRKYRYPYARGSIFFLDGTSVKNTIAISSDDGPLSITYTYDPEGLNAYAAGQLENVSSFTALTAIYELDKDGYITSFTEKGTVTDTDGNTSEVNMRISVYDMNNVFDIPYPVDKILDE